MYCVCIARICCFETRDREKNEIPRSRFLFTKSGYYQLDYAIRFSKFSFLVLFSMKKKKKKKGKKKENAMMHDFSIGPHVSFFFCVCS